jgi:hypothetical protein
MQQPAWTAEIRAQGERVRGVWHEGAYIELHFVIDGTESRYPEPFEVINVWDYSTGEVTIPHTLAGVKQALQEWAKKLEPGELPNYRNNVAKAAGGPF